MLWYSGFRFSVVQNELFSILSRAKVNDVPYQVVDYFQKKGQLVIYVMANKLSNR